MMCVSKLCAVHMTTGDIAQLSSQSARKKIYYLELFSQQCDIAPKPDKPDKVLSQRFVTRNEKGQAFLPDLFTMGRVMGLEPTAPSATNWCSNHLSYTRHRVARFIWPEACYVKRIFSLFCCNFLDKAQSPDFCGVAVFAQVNQD